MRRGNHVAGDPLADGGAAVFADHVQAEVDAGAQPGRRHHLSFVDVERGRVHLDPGKRLASSSAKAQWVVARRPSSRPAWASAKAPVQTESTAGAALGRVEQGSGGLRGGGEKTSK